MRSGEECLKVDARGGAGGRVQSAAIWAVGGYDGAATWYVSGDLAASCLDKGTAWDSCAAAPSPNRANDRVP